MLSTEEVSTANGTVEGFPKKPRPPGKPADRLTGLTNGWRAETLAGGILLSTPVTGVQRGQGETRSVSHPRPPEKPTPALGECRTLDALHLATALELRSRWGGAMAICSLDAEMLATAGHLGFELLP